MLMNIFKSTKAWPFMNVCVCNDECMCIVGLINNTILVLMYVIVRLVTD